MTWIKICGMTNLEDALTAVDAGADAVGFVFYERSPRNITAEAAAEVVRGLPQNVEKVGVFVDAGCDSIRGTVSGAGLTAVQLHGKISMDSVWQDSRTAAESVGVSKLIAMIPGSALLNGGIFMSERVRQKTFAVLIDAELNGASGGTGATFDWKATQGMVRSIGIRLPVIVAGGLTSENVHDAIRILKPWGLDVASGVELSPGKKDPDKIRAFVKAVRDFDSTSAEHIDRKTS